MSEEKQTSVPRKMWESALRTVKGDTTQNLVENFTEEMTLVAEGLCEDQAKLREKVDSLETQSDRERQRLHSEIEALDSSLREQQRESDERLNQLERRLSALEKHQDKKPVREKKKLLDGRLGQAIVLAAIVCGALVIVTLINALKG